MVDETKDLKPCPFCGGRAAVHCVDNGNTTICCECCGACIEERFHEHAVAAWNERQPRSEPLQHPHGILVTRKCNIIDDAIDKMGMFLKLVDKDEGPSMLYINATPAAGCKPTDAEMKYYSLTAGRSVALGRDPVLEAIERGDVKMRVVREPAPWTCSFCKKGIGNEIVHADCGDGQCGTFCSMECVRKAQEQLASLPKRESSVTVEDLTDDGND